MAWDENVQPRASPSVAELVLAAIAAKLHLVLTRAVSDSMFETHSVRVQAPLAVLAVLAVNGVRPCTSKQQYREPGRR